MTKKYMRLAVAAAMVGVALATQAALALAEARAQLDAAVGDGAQMAALTGMLSAEDQVSFLGEAVTAITRMPGSIEEKTARYLTTVRAALRAAAKGNVAALLAETFATVPPEALTVLNEELAAKTLSRTVDPTHPVDDATFVKIASGLLAKIVARTEGSDEADARNGFAIIMLLRASGGSPADLRETLSEMALKEEKVRDIAMSEWYPQAFAERGYAKSYDSILGYAEAGRAPDPELAFRLAGVETMDRLLFELAHGIEESAMPGIDTCPNDISKSSLADDLGVHRVPHKEHEFSPYELQTTGK